MEKTTAGIIKVLIDYVLENCSSPCIRIVLVEAGTEDNHTLMQWPSVAAIGDISDVPNIIGVASMHRDWIRPEHDLVIEVGCLVNNGFHKIGSIVVINE